MFWQNTFESVLDFQNTFEIYLLGQFIRSGEKLFQRYIRKRLKSVIALDEEEKIKIIILTNDTPFGRVASLSLSLPRIIGLLDPSSPVRLMASTLSLPDHACHLTN